jgi:cytochrome c oxidase assembly factor CtaG
MPDLSPPCLGAGPLASGAGPLALGAGPLALGAGPLALGPFTPGAEPLAHRAGGGGTDHWWEIAALLALAALAAGYGRGVQELWSRAGAGGVVSRPRVVAFAGGLGTLVLAQSAPVHELAEESFAGHMVQHMLFLVVAGPLLGAAAVGLPLTLAMPPAGRRRLARLRTGGPARWLRRPAHRTLIVVGVHTAVLWAWHLPGPYLAAAANPGVHLAEHASFVASAWLLWSAVLGPSRQRLADPVAFLALFAAGMTGAALGAVLTLAPAALYPAAAFPVGDALSQQQLAGLLMWIPMDVLMFGSAVGVFLRWLTGLERLAPGEGDLAASQEVGTR